MNLYVLKLATKSWSIWLDMHFTDTVQQQFFHYSTNALMRYLEAEPCLSILLKLCNNTSIIIAQGHFWGAKELSPAGPFYWNCAGTVISFKHRGTYEVKRDWTLQVHFTDTVQGQFYHYSTGTLLRCQGTEPCWSILLKLCNNTSIIIAQSHLWDALVLNSARSFYSYCAGTFTSL